MRFACHIFYDRISKHNNFREWSFLNLLSILITAIGLSMDAFAVSVSIGISCSNCSKMENALKSAGFFGLFQGIMPLIGFFASVKLTAFTGGYDKVIAFVILALLGAKMIYESMGQQEESTIKCYSTMSFIPLAIATSIDALAVGISFAVLKTNMFYASLIIALITGLFSFIGVRLGKFISNYVGNKAEIFGGGVLILIGAKILLF